MKIVVRCALLLLFPVVVLAQGTTGSIVGTVTTDGKPLPGVTVTAVSPSLQGSRTAVTGEAGGYSFPSLPPGEYTVTYELAGMQSARKLVGVRIADSSRADAELKVSSVSEAITVTAAAQTAEGTQVTTNFKIDQVNELPIDRSINAVTLLVATGALSLAGLGVRIKRGRLYNITAYAYAGLIMLFALMRSVHLAAAALLFLGLAMLINGALSNGIIQSVVPDELRGRVVATYIFVYVGFPPIGSFFAGLLADYIGVEWAIFGGGLVMLAYGIWAFAKYPEIRAV